MKGHIMFYDDDARNINAANNIVQIMKKNKEPIKIKTFHIEPDGIDKLDENDKLDAIMGSYKIILDKYKKSILEINKTII